MKNVPNSQFTCSYEFLICILYPEEVFFCVFLLLLLLLILYQILWKMTLIKRGKNKTVEIPCMIK